MLDHVTVVFSYATAVVLNLKTQSVNIYSGFKNVKLTTILYFQIHNKQKTNLAAVLTHQTTLGKELITFALCAQVIRLYSSGLMTENRNSGGFLILHESKRLSK